MDARTLSVTFEGLRIDGGVPLEDLQKTFQHLQNAVRITVEHLSGNHSPRQGHSSNMTRQASHLRLRGTTPGSLVAELALAPPMEGRLFDDFDDDVGQHALEAILSYNGDADGSVPPDGDADGLVPPAAVDQLRSIGSDLSSEVNSVWLGDSLDKRRVRLERRNRSPRSSAPIETAVLYGWLREVNWERRTAQLHDNAGGYVALRFDAAFDDEMVRLATQHVKISGSGRFNKHGVWTTVTVDTIHGTRSWDKPFDLNSLIEQSSGKVFDPEAMITTGEPFDVEAFIDTIHQGRDMSEPWPQDLQAQP
ncbi:MAG: hypothetical protein OXI96_04940 [Acidimicrobiaceae bacterium]|nr:hypothetical protein [Acidimicrobiaceae bacterium]